MLPHIPATRAMFAYPSESASSTVCGGGKTTPWPSCRLHVKIPANIMYVMRRGAGRVVARYPVERPRFSPWSPCCRRFCRLALRGIVAESPSTKGGGATESTCGFVFRGRFGLDSLLNLCKSERIAHPFHRVKAVWERISHLDPVRLSILHPLPKHVTLRLGVGVFLDAAGFELGPQ